MKKILIATLAITALFSACKKKEAASSPTPTASFTINGGRTHVGIGDADTFVSTSTNASSYVWDFGDTAGHSTIANPTYNYLNPGTRTIKLTVYNSDKSKSSVATQVITIDTMYNYPEANINLIPNTAHFIIDTPFTVNDIGSTYVTSLLWDFGDGTTSTQPSVSHIYTQPGTQGNQGYNIKLTVYHNGKALANSAQRLIYIKQ